MIAREPIFTTQTPEKTLPVAMEFSVCCRADIDLVVRWIMSSMRQFPFSVSDGFGVQTSVAESLNSLLKLNESGSQRTQIQVRTHITALFVRVQINDLTSDDEHRTLTPEKLETLNLTRTFMSTVEIQKTGRQIVLFRRKGQGAAISGPPHGYDFQI
ncbi:hypothetical protein SH668x_003068 [Planctomicrobium sp. SH668]|uniref:hypothetical protein n=1 Tax=Planctomicrobium sp. SH668 TaxID=3448126 RepID=UPI003F5C516F